MKYRGRAHKFGDNVNTDEIIPAKYLSIQSPEGLGKHCMENIYKNFAKKVKESDVIVAGRNFGCGSSREHAPIAIKGCGISCVVAESFARIFYRNAINIGLPIVVSPEAVKSIKRGNKVEVDTTNGTIRDVSKKRNFKIETFPTFIDKIIEKGGLMAYVKR